MSDSQNKYVSNSRLNAASLMSERHKAVDRLVMASEIDATVSDRSTVCT